MKLVVRLVLLVSAVLLVGGCSNDEAEQGAIGEGEPPENSLLVGYDQEPDTLNPFIVGGESVATSDMVAGILEQPYEVQPDLTMAPELAEGAPNVVSKDPLTIEYRLKDYLTFSDGEALTSADAKFTYRTIMDSQNNIISREGWDKIKRFETPDEQTVRIVFSEPYAAWRDLLSGPQSAILPEHVYAGEDFNLAMNDELVGSGPYTLREWNKGQYLVLEANGIYWGGAPPTSHITFRFIPDADELNGALQSGEVSFINPPLQTGLAKELRSYEGVEVISASGTTWEQIAFNTDEVDSPELRRAIAYGIDREKLLAEVLPGKVKPLNSVLLPEQKQFYVPAWKKYDFDLERAEKLVQEAASKGADPNISFTSTLDDELRRSLQSEVRRQLENVGITVEINNAPSSALFDERLPQGEFEMGEWAWISTPQPTVTSLFSAEALPPDGQNYYRYENPEASFLMGQADRAVDGKERAELLKQVQRIMADDLPVIPLYQYPVYYAYDENLKGPVVNPTLAGPFWNIEHWTWQE
ncbi:MAG: ABC transporter substrate-binding protein [Rubrobacteraceae bacterium]